MRISDDNIARNSQAWMHLLTCFITGDLRHKHSPAWLAVTMGTKDVSYHGDDGETETVDVL